MPRSLIAVPLVDDVGVLGVLEVLDKRGDAGFDLHDVELATVFARQATVAIRSSRIERDTASLLRAVLGAADAATTPAEGGPSAASRDAAAPDRQRTRPSTRSSRPRSGPSMPMATIRCGPWPTRSPSSARPIRASSTSSATCSQCSSSGLRAAAPVGRDERAAPGLERAVLRRSPGGASASRAPRRRGRDRSDVGVRRGRRGGDRRRDRRLGGRGRSSGHRRPAARQRPGGARRGRRDRRRR